MIKGKGGAIIMQMVSWIVDSRWYESTSKTEQNINDFKLKEITNFGCC